VFAGSRLDNLQRGAQSISIWSSTWSVTSYLARSASPAVGRVTVRSLSGSNLLPHRGEVGLAQSDVWKVQIAAANRVGLGLLGSGEAGQLPLFRFALAPDDLRIKSRRIILDTYLDTPC